MVGGIAGASDRRIRPTSRVTGVVRRTRVKRRRGWRYEENTGQPRRSGALHGPACKRGTVLRLPWDLQAGLRTCDGGTYSGARGTGTRAVSAGEQEQEDKREDRDRGML